MAIFWGTFFPLISELFTGEKSSLAAPWFDRYTTPLAIVLVLFTGIGPLLAWRRVSWASAKRVFLWPRRRRRADRAGPARSRPTPASRPWALALFVFAAFALTGLAQEFWRGAAGAARARRRLDAGGAGRRRLPQPPPLRRLHRPRRRRRAADRDRRLLELPDQTRRRPAARARARSIDGRTVTYVRPTVSVTEEALGFGAVLRVRAGRRRSSPSTRAAASSGRPGSRAGRSRSFFDGEATSEVGLRAGAGSDFWTAVAAQHHRGQAPGAGGRPRLPRMRPRRARDAAAVPGGLAADAGGGGRSPRCSRPPPPRSEACRRRPRSASPGATSTDAAPATFRVIVDPLVTWMWIGGLIALAGALIAIWPARGRAPRCRRSRPSSRR